MLEGVILAGGRGERFWPLSRRRRPKQLLALIGEESLLAATWRRMRARLEPAAIRVVAGEDLQAPITAELPELTPGGFIGEPVGRNTAPAIAVAAALGRRGGRDPLQLVVPADHWIPDPAAFWESVHIAEQVAAAADRPLVTFGVPITRPETGYGYIERGAPRAEGPGAYGVARFHEKPQREQAQAYRDAGGYYWNSGIFLWRASAILEELERHLPALSRLVTPLTSTPDPGTLIGEIFAAAPSESIDWGVLEHSARVAVVEAGFEWSDLGSWPSWGERMAPDGDGNVARGAVVSRDTQGCLLYAEQGLIATLGVRDLVVVRTGDATLVIDRERCQDIRQIIAALRELEGGETHL
ncbi:MAG: mannose-1-phosphate guanylyltransferase [Candidatus Eisenbacteria sp.]|nr:mannose-1-phosphate guanylyltransferase [Candidatus Eisenbacteria bacterium]